MNFDIKNIDLSEFEEMYYDENHTCHVLIWGETHSVIMVDLDLWKDVRTVYTNTLHKTREEWLHWKYNVFYKPGTLVGYHMTTMDFGMGVVVEVERIGGGIKLLIGDEIRSIEHHRVFQLDKNKYGIEE